VEGNTISLGMGRKFRILARCGRGAGTEGAAVAALGLRECARVHCMGMHGVCAPMQPGPEGALGHYIDQT
jgi:hypothetical protein